MNNTKHIQTILLLGALWGIAEATIGHLLHFLPCGFSGMVMFPIGFYFMYNAYLTTDKKSAVLATGIIAASIKFIDFILPMKSPMGIINPAMSIVLESLVVYGFLKVFASKKSFSYTFGLGLSWVVLFTLAQAVIFRPAAGLYLAPLLQMVGFILMNGIVSGFLVGLYLQKEAAITFRPIVKRASFLLPALTVLLAALLEIGNSIIF
ncbi:MAG: hypothetical protein ACLFQM_12640 [Fidelibacterota bacterium]